jgi:hypothetical protein
VFLLSLSVHSQRVFEEQAREVGIESLTRFKTFLALANDASKGDEIQDNISWVKEQLQDQGFEIKLLETSSLPLMIANLSIKEKLPYYRIVYASGWTGGRSARNGIKTTPIRL